jgi:3-hydroxybutyryl-CoA dehydrogenase
MNPVPKMRLLELIPGLATSADTLAKISQLGTTLGKEIVTSRDYPGFIVNRVLMPMINEAFTVLMEGIASREEIDLAMKLGTNHPMGPLALADFIGLDTCLAILEIMDQDLASPRFKPCPLLRQYVAAQWLGRKTGRGVYTYER